MRSKAFMGGEAICMRSLTAVVVAACCGVGSGVSAEGAERRRERELVTSGAGVTEALPPGDVIQR
jgi:hypothetical protein